MLSYPDQRQSRVVRGVETASQLATEGLIEGPPAHMGLGATLGEAVRFDTNGIPQEHLQPSIFSKKQSRHSIQLGWAPSLGQVAGGRPEVLAPQTGLNV